MTILTPFVYMTLLYIIHRFINDPMITIIVLAAMITWGVLGF